MDKELSESEFDSLVQAWKDGKIKHETLTPEQRQAIHIQIVWEAVGEVRKSLRIE